MVKSRRWTWLAPLAAGVLAAAPADEAEEAQVRRLRPLLAAHCFSCHGKAVQKGDLDLERLVLERPLVRNDEAWTRALEHARNGVMPPKGKPQPPDEDRRALVESLERALRDFDYSKVDDPGLVPARRLTHLEYERTLRDLLGIDLRIAERFPPEKAGPSGFDNCAPALSLQSALLERYFDAADRAVEAAFPRGWTPPVRPGPGVPPDEAAARYLRPFLERAWRRPAEASDLEGLLAAFRVASARGYEAALKESMKRALASPRFLLRSQPAPAGTGPEPVGSWELASRLSYFLWASMPDEALFALARQDRLRDPEVLRAQVDRLLADPRASSLGEVFAAQWLGAQHLGSRVRPDPIEHPAFTDSLYEAMRAEPALFFNDLVRENRPLPDLLSARWTFLNEELARYYRISGVQGPEMRKVEISDERRGGILGQAAILMTTSFPDRTSPVLRGTWILTDLLGTPPPPPPPDVGTFSPKIEDNDKLTPRRKMELHRSNPTCAACHDQIDPLGFGLENYDELARWRSKADARGKLPDGTEFSGPAGLKKVLVEKRLDDLGRQVARKMLSYALGRPLEYTDEPAVRKILAAFKADGWRMRTLVREVALSYPFRFRKNRSDGEAGR